MRVRLLLSLLVFSVSSFGSTPYLVTDLRTAANAGASSSPRYLGTAGGAALFVTDQKGLWRTDGTSGGTVKLSSDFTSSGGRTIQVGNVLYFGGGVTTYTLWKSDGTASGGLRDVPSGTFGRATELRPER